MTTKKQNPPTTSDLPPLPPNLYSELRPFLPKGTPWPISVEMLKKKTAKNSK
jgi:hypothetical protein